MEKLVIGAGLGLLLGMGPSLAQEVQIACSVSDATTFIGRNILPAEKDGPLNFTITPDGLKAPFGGDCAVLRGQVTASSIDVSCKMPPNSNGLASAINIIIDRSLGTFHENFDVSGGDFGSARIVKIGTCQRRDSF